MRLLGLLVLGLVAAAPAQQIRGTWVARDTLASRAKIVTALDALQQANLNLVCVNCWSRGFTLWPSDVLQRVAGVRQDPAFVGRDPMQELLTEAHRRGIEVEGWFEYGFCAGWSGWYPGAGGRGPVLNANSTWLALDNTGNDKVSDGNGGWFYWMAHENPAARAFLLDLVAEFTDRYDVDAVELDRIRYPSTAFGYDATTIAAYKATHAGASPPTNVTDAAWMRWRADGLNAFAAQVYARVKSRRSTVSVTNAPVVQNTGYSLYLQDWVQWVTSGNLDWVYPQVYRYDVASYIATLDANLALLSTANKKKFVPGMVAISPAPTTEVVNMVGANRARSLNGEVIWYVEGLFDDLPALKASWYPTVVSVPNRPAGWRPLAVGMEENDPSTTTTGTWTPRTGSVCSGGLALTANGGSPASVEFKWTIPAAGYYAVHAHQVIAANGTKRAPFRIVSAGGERVVRVDQSDPNRAGMEALGTFWCDAGTDKLVVRVSTDGVEANALVTADAIEFVPARFRGGPLASYGAGAPGASGVPHLGISGPAAAGGRLALGVDALVPMAPVALWLGSGRVNVPFLGGAILVLPSVVLSLAADAQGEAATTIDVPFDPALRGGIVQFQAAALDPAALGGLSLTQGVEASIR